jgi:hypothetical protein
MLLDDIINLLSDSKGSLNSALLKTKVLLHNIGKKDLAAWVTHELKGYPDSTVPDYRIVHAEVHAQLTSYTMQASNYLLPILHLTDAQRKNLTISRCQMSIDSIEESIKSFRVKGTKLIRALPPEYASLFQKKLTPGTNIISLWCEVNMVGIEKILSEVRSRLLDFTLELRGVVGIDVPESELAAKAAKADTDRLFQTAIYNPATVIIGSHNFRVNNHKEDIDGLITEVAKLGFAQSELDELRQAVLDDRSQGKTPDVTDGKTGRWFSKALKQAGKEVVKAGVDVVSATIVKAIQAYTGSGG